MLSNFRISFSWLGVVIICCISACSKTNAIQSISINDVYCNGKTVSIVTTKYTKHSTKGLLPDSGGRRLISESGDSWLISWTLDENKISKETPTQQHLGSYFRKPMGKNIILTGIEQWGLLGFGQTESVVYVGENDLRIIGNGNEKSAESNIETQDCIFTKSRKSMFSWSPTPAIYSIPEIKIIKKWEVTQEFEKFKSHFQSSEERTVILTEDLSHLIVLPQYSIFEREPSESETLDAFCFLIDENKFSTISLKGFSDVLVRDARVVGNELHWLIQISYSNKFMIIDSSSKIVKEISLPDEYTHRSPFWDPSQDMIWFIKANCFLETDTNADFDVSILEYQLSSGKTTEIILPSDVKLISP